jgi:hypothetical protein
MRLETFLVALWLGVRAFLRTVWRALTQLFHQVTGVFFLAFAAIGVAALVREWQRWPRGKLIAAGLFTAVFAWFTVSAFWKARKAGG